jgi:hypothetical protein
MGHLVYDLQISVRNDWGTEISICILQKVDMVDKFWLPNHELLHFIELWSE